PRMLVLGPAAPHGSGAEPTRAARTLLRPRPAHRDRDEAGETPDVVGAGLARKPRIDDRPHPRHRERGLGDRGRHDDAAPRPLTEREVLLGAWKAPVETAHVDRSPVSRARTLEGTGDHVD